MNSASSPSSVDQSDQFHLLIDAISWEPRAAVFCALDREWTTSTGLVERLGQSHGIALSPQKILTYLMRTLGNEPWNLADHSAETWGRRNRHFWRLSDRGETLQDTVEFLYPQMSIRFGSTNRQVFGYVNSTADQRATHGRADCLLLMALRAGNNQPEVSIASASEMLRTEVQLTQEYLEFLATTPLVTQSKEQMPGKVFYQWESGTPIDVWGAQQQELAGLLQQGPLSRQGINARLSRPYKLPYLHTLLSRWAEQGRVRRLSTREVRSYCLTPEGQQYTAHCLLPAMAALTGNSMGERYLANVLPTTEQQSSAVRTALEYANSSR